MPTPHEIGTLRARRNGESLFVGSSSGVFFINTVRRAFSNAAASTRRHQTRTGDDRFNANFANMPSPEDCIIGSETHSSQDWLNASEGTAEPTLIQEGSASWCQSKIEDIGELPDHAVAKELLITYFRTWHPLLPFLHGPTCLSDLEDAYTDRQIRRPKSLSTAIIFQCLFNIAKLDRPDLPPLRMSQIRSEEQLMLALSIVSLKCDLSSVQALLAAELYFIASMEVRAASTVGGLVLRSIFKSGLHRCPVRYTHLTKNDHDMRKRVFWSAYCLDRYVSQTLGHPLGIQDSDFDVCAPGDIDLHQPVRTVNEADEGTSPAETVLHLPANHPGRQYNPARHASESPRNRPREEWRQADDRENSAPPPDNNATETEQVSQRRQENETAQAQFVRYSQLMGRMMEMFHKSIHVRTSSRQNILFLKADIDAWGNDLTQPSQNSTISGQTRPASLDRDVFFWVSRQHLLLLVNRPALSLEPSSADFRYAAQICIGAARSIIRSLESHMEGGGALFWPGSIHSVWMSGLVMAFTCQLKLLKMANAINDIAASLKILKVMTQRWRMAQNCYEVLSMLLENIRNPELVGRVANGVRTSYARSFDSETMRGEKRPSGTLNDNLPDGRNPGNNQKRTRLPHDTRQASHASLATPIRRNTPVPMSSVNVVHDIDQCFDTQFGSIQGNDQTSSIDPLFLSQERDSSYGSSFHPHQMMPHHYTTNFAPFPEQSNIGMNASHVPTPDFGSSALYDVFDGAAWGPLLDMMEENR